MSTTTAAEVLQRRWDEVEIVLDALLNHERSAWPELLDACCGADLELRAAVAELLSRRAQITAQEGSSCGGILGRLFQPPAAASVCAGACIGPYVLRRELGRGGMGVVWLAEHADQTGASPVAIKLVQPWMATTDVLKRFSIERQALDSLQHRNIARLLGAEALGDGNTSLVLEYVAGLPIDEYCAQHRLDTAARLALFLTVARAVVYAHERHVVHRDLKPSNILVTAEGTVKLLDFGIAKLLGPRTDADSALTSTGQRWLTTARAAPEQLSREGVSVRTDVYQLGVLLYELLTGRLPFAGVSTRALERAIRAAEPPFPSRLAGASLSGLREDLDAIVMKAIRKRPGDRYASVAALADDIACCLAGRASTARSGWWSYRVQRFARQHALTVVAASAVVAFALRLAAPHAPGAIRVRR